MVTGTRGLHSFQDGMADLSIKVLNITTGANFNIYLLTRLIYYDVTAIKFILSILVVLIHTYFFVIWGWGSKKIFLVKLSFFFHFFLMAPQFLLFLLISSSWVEIRLYYEN